MNQHKSIDNANLLNDVFMNIVVSDPDVGEDFCRTLLSALLQREVGKVKVHAQRVLPGVDLDTRGVRLDIEVTEPSDDQEGLTANVYDIEPHNGNYKDLPKALRYRQAKIDSRYMKAGDNAFSHMPDLWVLWITDFDPFGKDYMMYTIKKRCMEIPDIEYDDGLTYYYFNTAGHKGGSKAIENVLEFIQHSNAESAVDETTRKLNGYVESVRQDPAVRGNYMTLGEKFDQTLREGIEIGKGDQLAELVCKKLQQGKTLPEIIDDLVTPEAVIKPIYDIAAKYAPDYNVESVLEEIHKQYED